jgi:hypothetical protein
MARGIYIGRKIYNELYFCILNRSQSVKNLDVLSKETHYTENYFLFLSVSYIGSLVSFFKQPLTPFEKLLIFKNQLNYIFLRGFGFSMKA